MMKRPFKEDVDRNSIHFIIHLVIRNFLSLSSGDQTRKVKVEYWQGEADWGKVSCWIVNNDVKHFIKQNDRSLLIINWLTRF